MKSVKKINSEFAFKLTSFFAPVAIGVFVSSLLLLSACQKKSSSSNPEAGVTAAQSPAPVEDETPTIITKEKARELKIKVANLVHAHLKGNSLLLDPEIRRSFKSRFESQCSGQSEKINAFFGEVNSQMSEQYAPLLISIYSRVIDLATDHKIFRLRFKDFSRALDYYSSRSIQIDRETPILVRPFGMEESKPFESEDKQTLAFAASGEIVKITFSRPVNFIVSAKCGTNLENFYYKADRAPEVQNSSVLSQEIFNAIFGSKSLVVLNEGILNASVSPDTRDGLLVHELRHILDTPRIASNWFDSKRVQKLESDIATLNYSFSTSASYRAHLAARPHLAERVKSIFADSCKQEANPNDCAENKKNQALESALPEYEKNYKSHTSYFANSFEQDAFREQMRFLINYLGLSPNKALETIFPPKLDEAGNPLIGLPEFQERYLMMLYSSDQFSASDYVNSKPYNR